MATTFQVTFDAADPAALAQFWAAALGYELDPPPAGFDSWDGFLDARSVPPEDRNSASAIHDPDGKGPRVFFQRVPEGKSVKNRVHLDLRKAPGIADDEQRMMKLEAECTRLVALGATRVERFERGQMSLGHIIMRDPEGNEFCLD
jgi:catechol 2,3-dioxygenase-like lactoylglutathione lyase family enzyme